jgi:hypothetical protein
MWEGVKCTWRESKRTEGIGSLIIESSQHLIQPVQANFCQEPLDVRARQAFVGFKTEASVLDNHSSTNLERMEVIDICRLASSPLTCHLVICPCVKHREA